MASSILAVILVLTSVEHIELHFFLIVLDINFFISVLRFKRGFTGVLFLFPPPLYLKSSCVNFKGEAKLPVGK